MEYKKYLAIKLVGHNTTYAFKNENKTEPNQPDYVGDGIAVWVNKKEIKPTIKISEEVVKDDDI